MAFDAQATGNKTVILYNIRPFNGTSFVAE